MTTEIAVTKPYLYERLNFSRYRLLDRGERNGEYRFYFQSRQWFWWVTGRRYLSGELLNDHDFRKGVQVRETIVLDNVKRHFDMWVEFQEADRAARARKPRVLVER